MSHIGPRFDYNKKTTLNSSALQLLYNIVHASVTCPLVEQGENKDETQPPNNIENTKEGGEAATSMQDQSWRARKKGQIQGL